MFLYALGDIYFVKNSSNKSTTPTFRWTVFLGPSLGFPAHSLGFLGLSLGFPWPSLGPSTYRAFCFKNYVFSMFFENVKIRYKNRCLSAGQPFLSRSCTRPTCWSLLVHAFNMLEPSRARLQHVGAFSCTPSTCWSLPVHAFNMLEAPRAGLPTLGGGKFWDPRGEALGAGLWELWRGHPRLPLTWGQRDPDG